MTAAPPRLWLVRHARPLIEAGTCYGQFDVAADAALSQASAQALHAALPSEIQVIHHSPLGRCVQLAQSLLALRPGAQPCSDPRLQEMDFGHWEGRAWNAIAREEIDAWTQDFTAYAPGHGESLARMLQRVRTAFAEARSHHGDVVWITHAGVIRCVLWLMEHGEVRLPTSREWTMPAPGFGEWFALPLTTP